MENSKGITLIELLLAIGIIAILVSIVLIAINPGTHLSVVRDAQRREEVELIVSAILQYAVDHEGKLPPGIPVGQEKAICRMHEEGCDGVSLALLVEAGYLKDIPVDPLWKEGESGTHYFVMQSANGEIIVSAPDAEGAEEIEVTR
jgi:prepilin-type N-terminal cleavage/methylation domain-containing protein